MAILDDEDKQALRELAFGKVEKIKDKVWRAILLVGLTLMQVVGVITLIRLRGLARDTRGDFCLRYRPNRRNREPEDF